MCDNIDTNMIIYSNIMFDYYQGDWKCNGRKMLQMLKLQAQQNLIMFFAITCNKLNKIF